jgi:hypothetical protein
MIEPPKVEVEDASITVGSSASVDIWVRNFPDDGFGLGCYSIRITYDPTMIDITGVSPGDAPFNSPIAAIYDDYVMITQFILALPGPSGDIRIADLEFTCLGEGETTLVPIIDTLANTNGDSFEATPVSGTINQGYRIAKTSISQIQDGDGVVVIPASIDSIIDPMGGGDAPGISIGSYQARALYNPTGIQMLNVRPGDPPFDSPIFNIDNPGGNTTSGDEPPTTVARLVPILTGCTFDTFDLEVTFDLISDSNGGEIQQLAPQTLTFQRGDVNGNGEVNIIDAMFGAQYLVGLRPVQDIRPLNMASVHHNGSNGDMKNIVDCMYIAQYVVGIRDCYFVLAQ